MKNRVISLVLFIITVINMFPVVGVATESESSIQNPETIIPSLKVLSDSSVFSDAEDLDNVVSTNYNEDVFNIESDVIFDETSVGSDCLVDDSAYLGLQAEYVKGMFKVSIPSSLQYLPVRSGPGSSYGLLGGLPNGIDVAVLEVSGNWGRIIFNQNSNSWICLDYAVRMQSLPLMGYEISTVKTAIKDEYFMISYREANDVECSATLVAYCNDMHIDDISLGKNRQIYISANSSGKWKFYLLLSVDEDVNNKFEGSLTEGYVVVDVRDKISYSANGGSGAPASQTKAYGQTIFLSTDIPTRFSYTFEGWATSANAIDVEYYPGDMYSVNNSVTLYAVWSSQDELEDSLTAKRSVEISIGGMLGYLKFKPSADGYYAFEGHSESEDTCGYIYDAVGNELAYDDDSGEGGNFKIVYQMEEGQTYNLAAKYFSRNKTGSFEVSISRAYKISYDGNGGTDTPVVQYKTHGQALLLSYVIPKRAGYVFNGWQPSGSTTTYSAGANFYIDKDTVLKATWGSNKRASGTCGTGLSWVLDKNGLLTVSGSGVMPDYTAGTSPWFSYASYVRNIEVQNGVENIGDYAFYNCYSLIDADLADSVNSIGDYAFANCELLSSVITGDELEQIGKSSFDSCRSLSFFDIPEGIVSIGEGAFRNCSSLDDVNIPAGISKIDKNTFSGCSCLVNVIIPEGVTVIEQGAFENCTDLRRVTLPKTVTLVNANAFSDCARLEYVYYNSTRTNWNKITFASGNDILLGANLYFISNEMYTVTYDYATNGGYSAGKLKDTVKSGDMADLNVTAMKTGWTFVGWNTSPNQSVALTSYNVTGNVTLYAIYKKTLKVKFYSSNNSLLRTQELTLVNNNNAATVSAPTPGAYSGWTALGWRDDTEAGSYEWRSGASISVGVSKSFYAVYRRNVTLTYNMNGNTSAVCPASESATQYFNSYGKKSNNTFVLPEITSAGTDRQFVAWSTASQMNSGVTYEPGETYIIDDNKTLYALWVDTSKCIITYKTGQYSIPGLKTKDEVTKNSVYTLPAYEAQNIPDGVGFSGYTITTSEGTQIKYPGEQITVSSNITIRIMFTLKLTTRYISADSKVSASYNGNQGNTSWERGFRYKKIDDFTFNEIKLSETDSFETILTNLEAGYEYVVWAYDKLEINGRIVEVNGTKERFKISGDDLTLNDTRVYLTTGDSYVLIANVRGFDTQDIVWQSSNRNVATVNNGYVTAIGKGETYITATTYDGRKSARCYVKVRNNRLPVDYNFSEWDLAMRLSSNGNEPDKCGAPVETNGANLLLGISALTNWKGITYEEDNPYPVVSGVTSYSQNAPVAYHLQSAYLLPRRTSPNDLSYIKNVKRALVNYGAVYAAFNSFSDCWNTTTSSLRTNYYNDTYYRTMQGAHAITIVGWDDTYKKDKFSTKPSGDGAFLCKNSYGDADCDNGYFYISYYDKNLGITDDMAVFPGVGSVDNYKNIYSHDPYGPTITYDQRDEILAVNVFKSRFQNEDVEAVSFYTHEMGTNYEIYVIPNYTGKAMLDSLMGDGDTAAILAASGTFDYAGYHTVKLTSKVPVTGNSFAVAVKLIKHGYDVGAYVELPIHTDDDTYTNSIYSNARANVGESYIYFDEAWMDISASNTNNCIKAFTNGTVQRLNLSDEPESASDKMFTVDELLSKGFKLNPRFVEHVTTKLELFETTENSGLTPSPTVTGTHDIELYANDIYPSRYSLKDMGYVTSVKNQLSAYGTCWAHAIYGSLESCMLRRTARTGSEMINNGLGDEDIVNNITDSEYVSVSSVSLDKSSYTMAIGGKIKLEASVFPSGADNREVSWVSNDRNVATVDIYGNVTAVDAGTAIITVSTDDGGKTASCTITVKSPTRVERIALDDSISTNYNIGERVFMHHTIYPTNAQSAGIIWTSSDETVATVEPNGLVTALSNGTVTITAELLDNGYTDEIELTIGDNHAVHITDRKVVKEIVFNRGEEYTVSFSLDNIPDDANVMVCVYGSSGQMLDMKFAEYKADYMEAKFSIDYISFVKIFVWDQNNSPLSVSDAIYT